jgi:hypothetical protein
MKEAASCIDARSDHAAALDASRTRRQQLSVKVTEEACRRFRRLAGEQGVTLGALFELALDALERERGPRGPRRPEFRSFRNNAVSEPLRQEIPQTPKPR